jgi:hypothetical protein
METHHDSVRTGFSEPGAEPIRDLMDWFYLEGWSPGDAGLGDALLEAVDSVCRSYLRRSDRAKKTALVEMFRQVYSECERALRGRGRSRKPAAGTEPVLSERAIMGDAVQRQRADHCRTG